MFLNVGKAGSDIAGASEAIARLISMILRMQSPVSQWDRLQEIENQLFGIGGRRSEGFGPNRVHSLPDAISQVIGEYLSGSASDTMEEIVQMEQEIRESLPLDQSLDFCPECGNMTLVSEEGCRKCRFCGYSEC
jgi:ribonucleoside-diphosphate reductase alpha chain